MGLCCRAHLLDAIIPDQTFHLGTDHSCFLSNQTRMDLSHSLLFDLVQLCLLVSNVLCCGVSMPSCQKALDALDSWPLH